MVIYLTNDLDRVCTWAGGQAANPLRFNCRKTCVHFRFRKWIPISDALILNIRRRSDCNIQAGEKYLQVTSFNMRPYSTVRARHSFSQTAKWAYNIPHSPKTAREGKTIKEKRSRSSSPSSPCLRKKNINLACNDAFSHIFHTQKRCTLGVWIAILVRLFLSQAIQHARVTFLRAAFLLPPPPSPYPKISIVMWSNGRQGT